jgi:hypothetical protein
MNGSVLCDPLMKNYGFMWKSGNNRFCDSMNIYEPIQTLDKKNQEIKELNRQKVFLLYRKMLADLRIYK